MSHVLDLKDPRWEHLSTFYGKPEELPVTIQSWLDALGTMDEDIVYRRDLHEEFFHQRTITNAAFAVVPWLVKVCHESLTLWDTVYLVDVGSVERYRREFGLFSNRKGTEEYPEWLMKDYYKSLRKGRDQRIRFLGDERFWERKNENACNRLGLIDHLGLCSA